MEKLNVVVALTTRENDYQAEQAVAAAEVAARLGIKIQIIYADNDAVNQTQQLIKIIQDPAPPSAILVSPSVRECRRSRKRRWEPASAGG
jgi:ABC-type xylose transport system substrate-binding protein